ncbi:sugar ABC transporter permease [Alicyclobacillus mali]|uniref:Sugar ABC transporter permease n=1 Tax=Alicyclobacillus mali (ex Roth et al. 2021) TaxID=1123961 RepID=A0ABS0EYC8_9BACL|nr:sugar ABC transporter permease [Alicyclobacillus mali (ex Roth et al. 2021)]MBF8376309.1 sugar ABC transporter permease [Alicyclobacillus mali (ex Roth et al. 2021)]
MGVDATARLTKGVEKTFSYNFGRRLAPYVFIFPSFVGVLVFLLVPALAVLIVSLFNWNMLSPPRFVGIHNYLDIFHDPIALHSMLTTVYYVILNIPVQTVLAILLALLMNRRLPGMGVFRAFFVLPWLAMPVAISVIWNLIFDPTNGVLNGLLAAVGLQPQQWLSSPVEALPCVAAVNVWQWTGYNMLFFLAGLQSIPSHLYEAANIDGAGRFRKFFSITLPLLRPTLLFVLITSVIGSFQVFDTVYVMTQGGPGTATNVYNYYIFQQGFQFFHMGYAAALSVILFVVILLVTLIQFRFVGRGTTYDMS